MHDLTAITIFKALADTTRLDIVRRLAKEQAGASCSDVRSCSSLSQPAMSHHFGKLVEAGVVLEHKDGKEKIYELNNELLATVGIDANKI